MRALYDLTLELSEETAVYPGDPKPEIRRIQEIEKGDALTVSHLSLHCHVGTHVDAPAHFIGSGETLDQLPLESFFGTAVVFDLTGLREIHSSDISELIQSVPSRFHLLLKTDNSLFWERKGSVFPSVSLLPSATRAIVERAPRSVGFDSYSLDPVGGSSYPSHSILARAGLPVFVALNLHGVPAGQYEFMALPLRLSGVEASPVRALLLEPIPDPAKS